MDQEKQLQDILEIVTFIKDNAATKEYLEERLGESENKLMNHIDTFVGLHQKLDIELTALRSKYDRLEVSMKKVLDHLNLQA